MKIWSYPNAFRDDHDELCDVIAAFDDHVFLFFDRESIRLDVNDPKFDLQWSRWKRKVISNQIKSAKKAEAYVKTGRPIYLDPRGETELPLEIHSDAKIHKFIVAHGAMEACRAWSSDNVSGSLGISYEAIHPDSSSDDYLPPFMLKLDRSENVHVLDSQNLELIFGELDTIFDFVQYIVEKEAAIQRYSLLTYCGEEDLLCEYLRGYSDQKNRYIIGPEDQHFDGVIIPEGIWEEFRRSGPYIRRANANEVSYFWDALIAHTCDNVLDGTIEGNADLPGGPSAIREMAREPRFIRRVISEGMINAIKNFPDDPEGLSRKVSLMPSFFNGTKYVFLQLFVRDPGEYATEYRPKRQHLLEIACAAAKERFPELKKIVGIAIDAPKHHACNSEDFILMEAESLTEETIEYYREENNIWRFFQVEMSEKKIHVTDFPIE